MASGNWTLLNNSLSQATIDYGVSAGFTPPNGGGPFVFGFNSLLTSAGCVGFYTNQNNYAPTPALKGGSISSAMKRGISAGTIDFAPMIFAGLQGNDVSSSGYLLGLGDGADQNHIVLRKGSPITSLPDVAPGTQGVLARSSAVYAADTWLHLRLDMIVNANGETIMKCFQSDLVAHTVLSPVWTAIPGMPDFYDDPIGVNSGSQPYTTSYFGWAFFSKNVNRRGYFKQYKTARQT